MTSAARGPFKPAVLDRLGLVESALHAHLRNLLDLGLGQAKAQRRLRHEERILAEQGVAEGQDIVRL